MGDGLFLDKHSLSLEPALLLAERAFKNSVCRQDLIPQVSVFDRHYWSTLLLTTSYFFNSLILDSREAPCQTRTSIPVEWASISFFHCMTATVGLENHDNYELCFERRQIDYLRYYKVRFDAFVAAQQSDHLDGLTHTVING